MRKFLTAALLVFSMLTLSAQQARRVYITLDVSGSMNGDKYILANYTTQMIVSLCDEDDEVKLFIGGKPLALSRMTNPLERIQKPFSSHSLVNVYDTQFGDIQGFNKEYSPSSKKQDWLFIIGDGVWDTGDKRYDKDRKQFQETVEGGTLHVCYLQTGFDLTEQGDFTVFVEPMDMIEIRKSSRDPKTIKEGCDFFARKILGFSDVPLKIKNPRKGVITLSSELPLSEFIVLYQKEVDVKALPALEKAETGGRALDVRLKGTPTTTPMRVGPQDARLSGRVWKVTSGGLIPAGEEVLLTFDKDIDTDDITIFPVVQMDIHLLSLSQKGEELQDLGGNVFCVERSERSAVVRIEMGSGPSTTVPEDLLKKSSVVVKANGRDYKASLVKGGFEATIDLKGDKTQYYAEIDCPGYFKKTTPIITLRKGDCKPKPAPPAPPVVMPVVEFQPRTFEQLLLGEIRGTLYDTETLEKLDPNKFDVTLEVENDFLFDNPRVSVDGNELVFTLPPKGTWCECLFPMDINMKVISYQKDGAFDAEGKSYSRLEQPIHMVVQKSRAWFPRCLWVIITVAGLFLLLLYIRSLMKKRRFKKNARISALYYNYYGLPIEGMGDRYLRKEGFGAWLSRWFSPRDERTVLSWSKPAVGVFNVVASESKEMVNIAKESFTPKTMDLPGYDPEEEDDKSKFVKWGDGETISVSQPRGGKDGDLTFIAGEEDDGTGFRLLLGVLMVVDLLAMAALIFMMVRSLI